MRIKTSLASSVISTLAKRNTSSLGNLPVSECGKIMSFNLKRVLCWLANNKELFLRLQVVIHFPMLCRQLEIRR